MLIISLLTFDGLNPWALSHSFSSNLSLSFFPLFTLSFSLSLSPLSLTLSFLSLSKSNNCLVGLELEKPFSLLLAFSTCQKTLPVARISMLPFCLGCPFECIERYLSSLSSQRSSICSTFRSSFVILEEINDPGTTNFILYSVTVDEVERPLKWHLDKRAKFSIHKLESKKSSHSENEDL